MLSMFSLPITECVYTFVDERANPVHIAASSLLAAMKQANAPIEYAEFQPSVLDALKERRLGVEEPHALSLPEEALEAPLLVGEWGRSHIFIDGAHRLWRRWKRGDSGFYAYVCPERVWRLFEIADMPGSGLFWDHFNRNAKVRGFDMAIPDAQGELPLEPFDLTQSVEMASAWRSRLVENQVQAMKPCQFGANRFSQDQYRCIQCGLVWDIDEPRPPCQST